MNRVLRSGLAVAACLSAAAVGGVAVGGVAYADATPPTVVNIRWIGATDCGDGTISDYQVVDAPIPELRLTGEAHSCPPETSGPYQRLVAFGIIAYNTWGAYVVGSTLPGTPGVSFTIEAAIRLDDTRPDHRVRAVCLAASPDLRLSCLSVVPPDGPPLGAPIAVDDPLVSVPAGPEGHRPGNIGGYCGGCVGRPNQ